MNAAEIRRVLEQTKFDASIYITLETLQYLKKGGRITPVAAAVGALLRIRPVLTIVNGGKLDAFTKARTQRLAKDAMINAIRHDLEQKFQDPEGRNSYFAVAYTDDPEQGKILAEELDAAFPDRLPAEIAVNPLSCMIACHIGPGALGAAVFPRLPELS